MLKTERKAYEIPDFEAEDFFRRANQNAILTASLASFPSEYHYLIRVVRNAAEAPRPKRAQYGALVHVALRFQRSIRGELLNVIPEERELKQKAFTRLHHLCLQYQIVHPELSFKLQGTTAGRANKERVRINMILLAENLDETLKQTIPHELCHAWKDQLEWRGRPHGKEWKSLMRRMEVKPDVCHSMDTTRAKAKPKPAYAYVCKCRTRHPLTPHEHSKIEHARKHQYTAYCIHCEQPIQFLGLDHAPNRLVQNTP